MSFAAAAFLAGLAALALPWWLHRRDTVSGPQREVSSLYLMRASEAPQQRRKVLKHRLLLALRLGLLAVLALAFAQPLLERPPVTPQSVAQPPRVVVLDTSLSMAASFGEARRRARALLSELAAGTPAALVTAGADTVLAAPLTTDRQALLAAVDAATPGYGRLAFDGLLNRVTAMARALTDAPIEVHLVSDFQQSAMPGQFNALVAGAAAPLVLHRVAAPAVNYYVAAATAGEAVRVTVVGFASASRRLTVSLTGPEGALGERRLEVPAGARATVEFPRPDGAGWLQAAVDADDPSPGDDVAYLVLAHDTPVPLPVFAAPGSDPAVRYLEAAVAAGSPGFRPAEAQVRGSVAVAVDPAGLTADRLRLLERHLGEGGGVLAVAGPRTARSGRLPWLQVALTPRQAPAAAGGVSALDPSHPVLARFSAWRQVAVFRYLAADAGEGGSVLAAVDDGGPLLIEQRAGAGRVLALLTALDPDWSTLVAEPAFVAFVGDALRYLAEDHLPAAAVAGQPLALPAANVQVFGAGGERLLSLDDTVGRPTVRLAAPGVYTVRTPNRQRLLAVNIDPREADPTVAEASLLARWQDAVSGAAPEASPAAAAAPQTGVLPLAPWLLVLLLVLAVAEPLAANLGRRRVAA